MALSEFAADALAIRILDASKAASSIPPITDAEPGFDLHDAYEVSAAVIRRRVARGEHPIGWKIGFTNRTIWNEYGVHAPIWGPIYATTVEHVTAGASPVIVGLRGLLEPRVEPEIVLRLGATPDPLMDAPALLECVDAVGHGFELVQSLYPGWRFRAADTVAAFALHGLYRCGPLVAVGPARRDEWLTMLENFDITLFCGEVEMDRGIAANVLGGPIHALGHLVRGLAEHPLPVGLGPGDLVTTGTVTRAFPVQVGERWRSAIEGLPLPGLAVTFE